MGSIARKQQRVKEKNKQEAEDNAPLAAPKASKSKRADSDDEPLVEAKKQKTAAPVIVAKSRLRPSVGSIARRQQRVREKTNKWQKTRHQYPP